MRSPARPNACGHDLTTFVQCGHPSETGMPFDHQPILSGVLLSLNPLRESDFDALFCVASDPLIWEQHPANDRYKREVFRAFFDEAMNSRGALLATDNATGRVIGSSRYDGYDAKKSTVEVGWTFLARSHWGGAYNGEMKRLMLDHAFRFVTTVTLMIGVNNRRSRKAAEKIGGVYVRSTTDSLGRESVVYELRPSTP